MNILHREGASDGATVGNRRRKRIEERGDIPDWDKVPVTTTWERWAYYIYYNGNNGINNYSYVPLIIQFLATGAGVNPYNDKPCDTSDYDQPCVVPIGVVNVNVSAMIILSSALSFFVQALLLTTIGSLADYGNHGRSILFWITIISCAAQGLNLESIFGLPFVLQIVFLAFTEPLSFGSSLILRCIIPLLFSAQWWIALIFGIIVYISYGASLVFYAAIFPRLALNEKVYRDARRSNLPQEDLADVETRCRNHISTVSTAWSNVGFFIVEMILVGVFQMPGEHYANNVASAVCGVYWLVNAIPWFVLEACIPHNIYMKKRPGPPLPENSNYLTQGWKQVFTALKEIRKLSQLFLFLLGYFLLSDAINATSQVISVIQNKVIDYSGFIVSKEDSCYFANTCADVKNDCECSCSTHVVCSVQSTLFGVLQAITSTIGCLIFLYVQKYSGWRTKTMLQISNVLTIAIPVWGALGLSRNLNFIGYRNLWEYYLYQVYFGIFTAPTYAYTQTMMSELIPAGRENMFFALFGIANKVSSFVGPLVIGAVIQATNNEWDGFLICSALQVLACIVFAIVNMRKADEEKHVYETKDKARGGGGWETGANEQHRYSVRSSTIFDDDTLRTNL
ncbi:LOW QUALITY PROTEIN: autophagy-related protein 22-like protein [Jimgerdemannia flammicorona]|uniref:Autophagy-related protein n=1 Tax=Jimgerdemannia flammicorona TaxID=994334 RepID=A0A433CQX5_9FUNG|nr:LOW QUALITY PROTEIN: autophagy-related protein 22-like protein [Jimgerdemannia flammicorona]